jgi:hypothetical protein
MTPFLGTGIKPSISFIPLDIELRRTPDNADILLLPPLPILFASAPRYRDAVVSHFIS